MSLKPSDLVWAEKADALQFEQLAIVREAAEKWRNGLAALTGLFSAAALLKAPDLGSIKPEHWRWLIAALLTAGLLSLLLGSWMAMTASFGLPKRIRRLDGRALRDWETEQATAAAKKLTFARRAFIVGLLALIAAVLSAVLTASVAKPPVFRVDAQGQSYCGQLTGGPPSAINVTTSGTVHSVPLANITNVTQVSSC